MLNIKIHNVNGNIYCEICNEKIENDSYDNIESDNYPIKLNCGHSVHYQCLYTLKSENCPCCNKKIDNDYIIDQEYFPKEINNSILQKLLSIFI
jgi:hypothetical protein